MKQQALDIRKSQWQIKGNKDQMERRILLFYCSSIVLRRGWGFCWSSWLSFLPENEFTSIVYIPLASFDDTFHHIPCVLVVVCSIICNGKLVSQILNDQLLTLVDTTVGLFGKVILLDFFSGASLSSPIFQVLKSCTFLSI